MKKKGFIKSFAGICAYDGTRFDGWQSQKNKNGVYDVLKASIEKTFNTKIELEGASRTDSGVHSIGQCIKIQMPQYIDCVDRIRKIINDNLPQDICITKLNKCKESFSPRYNAIRKTYVYRLSFQKPMPSDASFTLYYPYKCNIAKVKKVLKVFIGRHNFKSFCTKPEKKDTIREIECAYVKIKNKDSIEIYLVGQSFLRYMVRRLIGAAIESGTKMYNVEYIKKILDKKDPNNALLNLPAKGLTLLKIEYDNSNFI
jgi:tRNA pseudouridine38-40 synthase